MAPAPQGASSRAGIRGSRKCRHHMPSPWVPFLLAPSYHCSSLLYSACIPPNSMQHPFPACQHRSARREACSRAAAGRRWGRPALWLHVDCSNHAAISLYCAAGFHIHATTGLPPLSRRRFLMQRPLPRRAPRPGGFAALEPEVLLNSSTLLCFQQSFSAQHPQGGAQWLGVPVEWACSEWA
jgi:hypothetical protein